MQVTFESTEPVEQVVAVLAALYRVPVAIAPATDQPAVTPSAPAPTGKAATPKRTATPKPAKEATASRSRRTGRGTPTPVDTAAARDHGITVNARGALPATVLTAYRAATE